MFYVFVGFVAAAAAAKCQKGIEVSARLNCLFFYCQHFGICFDYASTTSSEGGLYRGAIIFDFIFLFIFSYFMYFSFSFLVGALNFEVWSWSLFLHYTKAWAFAVNWLLPVQLPIVAVALNELNYILGKMLLPPVASAQFFLTIFNACIVCGFG